MTRRILPTLALAALFAGMSVDVQAQRPRQDGLVRIQLQIQMFVAGPTDESEEAQRQRERARRALYDMAARECELLRAVIANDCRLESVNVNLNRMVGNPQIPSGYQVTGSMAYHVTLK